MTTWVENNHLFMDRSRRKIMVFYTPSDAFGPGLLATPQALRVMPGDLEPGYEAAKQSCRPLLRPTSTVLGTYLGCLARHLKSHIHENFPSYSPFRGFAAVVQLPNDPSNGYYSRPGLSSPRGHIIKDPIWIREIAPFPWFSKDAVLLVIANAPIVMLNE